MEKAARSSALQQFKGLEAALIALHEGLHDNVLQDAGNDYCNWHPVGFGGDGLCNWQALDAVVALDVRIAADVVAALRSPLNQHHEEEDEAEDEENGRIKSYTVAGGRRVAWT